MSTYKVYGGVPTMETEKLQNLLDTAEGGASGSGLPEVTADDNGKVLTVVDGEWDKAESSGGGSGDILFVEATDDGEDIVLNKTWNEINNASFAIGIYTQTSGGEIHRDTYILNSVGSSENVEGYEGIIYSVDFLAGTMLLSFSTLSADGYPSTADPFENLTAPAD